MTEYGIRLIGGGVVASGLSAMKRFQGRGAPLPTGKSRKIEKKAGRALSVRLIAVGVVASGLSACVSAPPGQGAGRGETLPPPPAIQYSQQPQVLTGLDAKQLVARFGEPRLDIHDRTVRKMQFMTAGGRCVLDAYLYAAARGREPVVAHMETRLPDGRDVDPANCGIR